MKAPSGNRFELMRSAIRRAEEQEQAASASGDLAGVAAAQHRLVTMTKMYADEKGWGSGMSRVPHPTQPGVELYSPQTVEGRRRLHTHKVAQEDEFSQAMRTHQGDDAEAWAKACGAIMAKQGEETSRVIKGIESMEALGQQLKINLLMANLNRAA